MPVEKAAKVGGSLQSSSLTRPISPASPGIRAANRPGLPPDPACTIIHRMNNFYSPPSIYYPRWLTPVLWTASQSHPVIVLTGARQVGKSTLLLNAESFCNWRFQTMDDFDVLSQAHEKPEALWAGTDTIVLDETQKYCQPSSRQSTVILAGSDLFFPGQPTSCS